MKTKEYYIDNFKKLANIVNEDNFKTLSIDIAQVLISYHLAIRAIREKSPLETNNKKNSELIELAFRFIDDGKNDFLGYNITNKETGEIKKIRY